jgi:hypothetical protein
MEEQMGRRYRHLEPPLLYLLMDSMRQVEEVQEQQLLQVVELEDLLPWPLQVKDLVGGIITLLIHFRRFYYLLLYMHL